MLYPPFCFISNFDFGFVISDPENPRVLTFSQIYNAFDFWPAFWDLAPLCVEGFISQLRNAPVSAEDAPFTE